jgi:nicotinamidase-related amidase
MTGLESVDLKIDSHRACVLAVDIQERLVPSVDQGHLVATKAGLLVEWMAAQNTPIAITEHVSQKLGATHFSLPLGCKRFLKSCFSALGEHSAQVIAPSEQVVIFGMEAHVCVLQTVLDLVASGKKVFVVADLTTSACSLDRDAAVNRMKSIGAQVVTSEMLLFEWVGDSRAGSFNSMLELVKTLRKLGTPSC